MMDTLAAAEAENETGSVTEKQNHHRTSRRHPHHLHLLHSLDLLRRVVIGELGLEVR